MNKIEMQKTLSRKLGFIRHGEFDGELGSIDTVKETISEIQRDQHRIVRIITETQSSLSTLSKLGEVGDICRTEMSVLSKTLDFYEKQIELRNTDLARAEQDLAQLEKKEAELLVILEQFGGYDGFMPPPRYKWRPSHVALIDWGY